MRTSIFNNFANLDDTLSEDFKILWGLKEEARAQLITKIPQVYKAKTNGELHDAMDKVVSEIEENATDLLRTVKLLYYIYREWSPIKDTPEGFIKDLAELQFIPKDQVENAEKFLFEYLSLIQDENNIRLRKMYSSSVVPTYQGISTVIDFRAVISTPYRSIDINQSLEDYAPRCVGFAPVVITKIKYGKNNNNKEIVFQATAEEIQAIIDELSAALKDLNASKNIIPGEI